MCVGQTERARFESLLCYQDFFLVNNELPSQFVMRLFFYEGGSRAATREENKRDVVKHIYLFVIDFYCTLQFIPSFYLNTNTDK